MHAIKRTKKSVLLGSSALLLWAGAAQAQVAPADTPVPGAGAAAEQQANGAAQTEPTSSGAGDIVVTAQRRPERLVDVPMSIVALSGQDLAKAGVVSVHDIANVVSGVQINFAGCCTQPAIWGISTLTTGVGFENNVALYVDGFYSPDNVTINADLANISSVEVLKGPQGTLYGRNATGGAILINTLAPSKTFTGKFAGVYGRFNDRAVNGYVSGPITDNIRYGVAAYVRRSDSYNRRLNAVGDDIGPATPQRQYSVRAKLEADVTSDVKVTLGYNYGLSDDPRGLFFDYIQYPSPALPPSPPRASKPFQVSENRPVTLIGKVHEGTLKTEIDTPIGLLTHYAGYAHRDTLLKFDFDGSYADLNGSRQDWSQNTWQTAADLNIDKIEKLDLLVGVSYYHDNLHHDPFQLTYANNRVSAVFSTELIAETFAGYADGSYHVSDALVLSAGARYTHEKKTGSFVQRSATGAFLYSGFNDKVFTAFTPRASIRYQLAPRTNVYASVTRGFRSGGFQPSGAVSQLAYIPYKPEKITAYEVGLKTTSRNIQFSTAVFYYDYRDLQVGITIPNPNGNGSQVSQVSNAKKAEVYGIDGDLNFELAERFNVHLGGAYLHARYKDFTNAIGTGLNIATGLNVTNQKQDWSGEQMTRAPGLTGILGADYTIEQVVGGSLALGTNIHYTSSYTTNAASLFGPLAGDLARKQRYRQDGYVLVNLQANWTDMSGHYHLGVFGNNVTDKLYRLTYSGSAFGDYSSYAAPATYGVRVGYDF